MNICGFAETLDFIEQVAKEVVDESRDMDQVYEDVTYRKTRHQPNATLSWNKKFPCDIQRVFDYFNYWGRGISFSVGHLVRGYGKLNNEEELGKFLSSAHMLNESITLYLKGLLGSEEPDYLMAIRNGFNVSNSVL